MEPERPSDFETTAERRLGSSRPGITVCLGEIMAKNLRFGARQDRVIDSEFLSEMTGTEPTSGTWRRTSVVRKSVVCRVFFVARAAVVVQPPSIIFASEVTELLAALAHAEASRVFQRGSVVAVQDADEVFKLLGVAAEFGDGGVALLAVASFRFDAVYFPKVAGGAGFGFFHRHLHLFELPRAASLALCVNHAVPLSFSVVPRAQELDRSVAPYYLCRCNVPRFGTSQADLVVREELQLSSGVPAFTLLSGNT